MEIKKQSKNYKSLHKLNYKPRAGKQKFWLGSYILMAVIFVAAYLLLKLEVFNVFGDYKVIFQKTALGGFFSVIVLAVAKFSEIILTRQTHNPASSYNIVRMIRLLSIICIILIVVSFLFKNWYTAAVSLGIISLILGFALQTPISSFIGWLYIVIRAPFHVGERIQIDTFKGDVVEINYLDTTLWEFGGDYLSNDLPSGRLIRFPNSLVFASAVFNYSWKKFPYIWNEIPFHVAYESDLDFVTKTIKAVATKELGEKMAANIQEFKKLVDQTAVDELDIKEYPYVALRINTNTWVEISLTYIVEPKQAAVIRTNLIKAILDALLAAPDKVMFPKSNNR